MPVESALFAVSVPGSLYALRQFRSHTCGLEKDFKLKLLLVKWPSDMDGAKEAENLCSSTRQSGSWEKETHPILQEVAVSRLPFRIGDALCLFNPELQ